MVRRPKETDSPGVSAPTDDKPRSVRGQFAHIDSELALRAAHSNCTLLITGETGVGKGHLARWLHEQSARAGGPYIPVNCGANPETLIDSQLFGHARGSFSGAMTEHLGLVRAAERGTILFDEVSELPHSAQNRLLRLLQDREVQPVGHSRPVIVDVRVFAATNVDLTEAVANRRFREDLLYRLDVLRLHVPPLRERLDELPELINRFNAEFAQLYQQEPLAFESSAINVMLSSRWPGNIRQLRTVVERLHVLCPNQAITATDVLEVGNLEAAKSSPEDGPRINVKQLKHEQLQRILEDSHGSISRAAKAFGVHRSTIYRWLRGH